MKSSSRLSRAARWLLILAMPGILPAYIMRCDKAALNFQRGFFTGLGAAISAAAVDAQT